MLQPLTLLIKQPKRLVDSARKNKLPSKPLIWLEEERKKVKIRRMLQSQIKCGLEDLLASPRFS